MAEEAFPRLVFVAHNGNDVLKARELKSRIVSTGAACFLAVEDIKDPSKFKDEIREKLSKADELVALTTPWAITRDWVKIEVGVAWGRGIPRFLLLDGMTAEVLLAHPELPVCFEKAEMLPLDNLEDYLGGLSKRVRIVAETLEDSR